jgi:hypothetical protein
VTSDPDAVWRRPAAGEPAQRPGDNSAEPPYTGPPRTERPPQNRPAPLIQPLPPPRVLPAQDHDAIDAEEQRARIITYGLSLVAGVVAFLLLLFTVLRALAG